MISGACLTLMFEWVDKELSDESKRAQRVREEHEASVIKRLLR